LASFNTQITTRQGSSLSDPPIPNDKRFWYPSMGFGAIDSKSTGSDQHEYTTVSVLGRVHYNYRGKYFLNASWRNDGTSRLIGKNHFQQFWALGAAWELSQESFIQNISRSIS